MNLLGSCRLLLQFHCLKETTSAAVITRCKSQFARHGIPDILFTDNGPQFSSQLFHDFSIKYQFKHNTSSPLFPQSNGKVEKAVQTVKSILKKARDDKQDPYLALLAFRNTPVDDKVGSPVQQLMGRRTKTLLPTTKELLLPKTIRASTVRNAIAQRQQRQKYYYDRLAQPLSQLSIGDSVTFQCNKTWKRARITGVSEAPRSYWVTTPEGKTYRRNRRHIRSSQAYIESDLDDDGPGTETRDMQDSTHASPSGNVVNTPGDRTPPEGSSLDIPSTTDEAEPTRAVPTPRRSKRMVSKPERYVEVHASHF